MIATKTLPEGFALLREINLQKDQALLIKLKVWGLALLPLIGYLLLWLSSAFHPEFHSIFEVLSPKLPILTQIMGLILGLVVITVLHELVHGASFWIITRQLPRFGFRGAYAFAAAPDWYIRREAYFLVGAAPLVLISIVGLVLIPVIPAYFLLIWLVCLLMNSSGSVGDVYVLAELVRQPATAMIQDRGDMISIYAEAAK